MHKCIKATALWLVILASHCNCALADVAGSHPNYVQALSDLRGAKYCIAKPDTPTAQAEEVNALQEIEACLKDIMSISVVEQKDVKDTALPDTGDRGNRIARSLELLGKAQQEISAKEDDTAVLKQRASALKHVEAAIGIMKQAAVADATHK